MTVTKYSKSVESNTVTEYYTFSDTATLTLSKEKVSSDAKGSTYKYNMDLHSPTKVWSAVWEVFDSSDEFALPIPVCAETNIMKDDDKFFGYLFCAKPQGILPRFPVIRMK